MRKAFVLICLALLLAVAGCRGVSSPFRTSALIASDSLSRLQNAADGSGYQLRLVETEKAVDAAKRVAETDAEKEVAGALNTQLALMQARHGDLGEESTRVLRVCESHVNAVMAGGVERGNCKQAYDDYIGRLSAAPITSGQEWTSPTKK